MVKQITIEEFLELRKSIPVIDVRSPGEFEKGHIPGAYNIPLFSNEERARVGIAYKKQGKQEAIKLGLEIVGPKMRTMAEEGKKIAGAQEELLVYCWRGGMRSANMAWLFSRLGIQCRVMEGGYKAFRRYGRELIRQNKNLIVLGGMTGSGKTDILDELNKMGEQVLNLEYLAHHKGSAFGSIGEEEQYPTEHFENLIFDQYTRLDFNRPVWVEDESKKIGKNIIPDELYAMIRQSPVIKVNLPKEKRVGRLVKQYTEYGDTLLKESIEKIDKRLGYENARDAIRAIDIRDYHKAARIVLNYYDKSYNYGLSKRDPATVYELIIQEDNPKQNANLVKEYALNNIMILSF